ncbi:CBS domain-containing protein [Kribbella antibiotica]|nr:CBS domain-containing protein [Kribbella antibiotica]
MPPIVADCMITAPKTLPLNASVEAARAEFEDTHVHLLLLVADGILHGTILRTDLLNAPPETPALSHATLTNRTIAPNEPITTAQQSLARLGQRRLAVVDATNRLLGLLCLKRDHTGFCTDEGVAARARERDHATR